MEAKLSLTDENQREKIESALPELLARLRTAKGRSRGQLARRLGISQTVLYNMETGRSRVRLDLFFSMLDQTGFQTRDVLKRHMFSVQELRSLSPQEMVTGFRARLGMSQKDIAVKLGYKSGSIIHHFEKGLRIPDLSDFIFLMILAGDNVRGLILELTNDAAFAERFPTGTEASPLEWHEYWEHFYIPAIRHIMRTHSYRSMRRYHPGYFADILGITYQQERYALKILAALQLIRWENARPEVDEERRIAIPKDIPKEKIDQLKFQWLDFSKQHYRTHDSSQALMTLDVVPVSAAMFDEIRAKIRRLQDEIHNMEQKDTDAIAYIGWLSNRIAIAG